MTLTMFILLKLVVISQKIIITGRSKSAGTLVKKDMPKREPETIRFLIFSFLERRI